MMSGVQFSCYISSLHRAKEQCPFAPFPKAPVDADRYKSPCCFLFSQQQTTPAQESIWSLKKWPQQYGAQNVEQDYLPPWSKWPLQTAKQVSRQGPGPQQLLPHYLMPTNSGSEYDRMLSLVKDCHCLTECNDIHVLMIKQGFVSDLFFGSTLIDMYAKVGSIEYACMVFLRLPEQDVVTWTALILGYASHGLCHETFQLFHVMQQGGVEPNHVTCFCLIKACATLGALEQGKRIHVYLSSRGFDSSSLIGNSLSDMYMKCGSFEDAELVFRRQPSQDVVAWNVLIGGLSQHGDGKEALQLFQQMQQSNANPNETTFVSVLQACASIRGLGDGERIYEMVLENGFASNIFVGNSLLHMYVSCGKFDEASILFTSLPQQDVISWNVLISGLSQHGFADKVCELYKKMIESEVTPNDITFIFILEVLSGNDFLESGMQFHDHILKLGLDSCLDVNKSLILMYSRCGSTADFEDFVCTLPPNNMILWNAVITGMMQHGSIQEFLPFLQKKLEETIEPLEATCVCLLKSCNSHHEVQLLHAFIVEHGLESDSSVANTLAELYSGLANLNEVCLLFNRLPKQDVALRITVIEAYVQDGYTAEATYLLNEIMHEIEASNLRNLVRILGVCSNTNSLIHGMQAHVQIVKFGFDQETLIGNALITMYSQCGSLDDLFIIFDNLAGRDVVTWNAFLTGCLQRGLFEETIQMFERIQEDGVECDQVTFICVLQACADLADLEFGHIVHTLIVKRGIALNLKTSNTLIDMYGKCNSTVDAAFVFSSTLECDVASWNIMIGCALKDGSHQWVFSLFDQMQRENLEANEFTYASVLQSCSLLADINKGMQVHLMVLKKGYDFDSFVGSSLITMYAKSTSLDNARRVFECLAVKNPVIWSALIAGYVQNGQLMEAIDLFQMMEKDHIAATRSTLLCMLQVFSGIESFSKGQRVHALIIESGLQDSDVSSCLIDMYGKCWHLDCASVVFNQSYTQDILLWNAWIASQLNSGQAKDALQSFKQMQFKAVNPDRTLLMLILRVCSSLAALEQGNQIHSLIVENGFYLETSLGNTLIHMYAKCGSLDDANMVFQRLPERNHGTWSAMVSAFAEHSNYVSAASFFEQMHGVGLVPDNIAYLSILSACNNVGLVNEASAWFKKMRDEHGLEPMPQHYYCLSDLFGRSGQINEAKDLLDTLHYPADRVAWSSLVKSCEAHGKFVIGRQCFDHLKDKGAADYIHMSDLYSKLGMHLESENTELTRKTKRMWKKPGTALIEINQRIHEFVVGDSSHPEADDILARLKLWKLQSPVNTTNFKRAGVLSSYQGKGDASCGHCEKQAVAFGLLSLPEGTTIRIAKNLRVCRDCHKEIAVVSKSYCREIVIVDTKYVHHFKGGMCSCNDYAEAYIDL